MKHPQELNEAKVPIVRLSRNLERFRGRVLFPEKLEAANRVLANVGLPKTASSKAS